MTQQYAINLRDGRVILCTRETLANIDYHAISERVAVALEDGTLDKKEVIAKVKGKLLTCPEEWDRLLEEKTTQNMRQSPLKRGDAEPPEAQVKKEEVKDEFDMEIPEPTGEGEGTTGEGEGETEGEHPTPKKKSAKKGGKKKDDEPTSKEVPDTGTTGEGEGEINV